MNEIEAIEKLKKISIETELDFVREAIETVLNFIEKCKSNVNAKNKRLEEYAEELEKKDKIIDLMASAICYEPLPTEEFCASRNIECPVVGGNRDCRDCIKQYFNQKIEKGE